MKIKNKNIANLLLRFFLRGLYSKNEMAANNLFVRMVLLVVVLSQGTGGILWAKAPPSSQQEFPLEYLALNSWAEPVQGTRGVGLTENKQLRYTVANGTARGQYF